MMLDEYERELVKEIIYEVSKVKDKSLEVERIEKVAQTLLDIPNSFAQVLEQVKKKSPEETRASLIRAGIINELGELTEKYRTPPRRNSAIRPTEF